MEWGNYHAVDISGASLCLLQLVIGGIMLGFGISYQDNCENGATDYLVTGGAIIIAANVLPFTMAIIIVFSGCECVVIKSLLCIQSGLPLVSFGVTIWVRYGSLLILIKFKSKHLKGSLRECVLMRVYVHMYNTFLLNSRHDLNLAAGPPPYLGTTCTRVQKTLA